MWSPLGACSPGAFALHLSGVKQETGETWCQSHLADQQLHRLLEKVDADLAQRVCRQGCGYCGGRLHRADYNRKPRGGPEWDRRYSFCCAQQDCRRRRTPESVRFMGRRVYTGLVVVLITTMIHGLKPACVGRIREALQIDSRTLKRWRQWWLGRFVRSSFWKAARARFMPPVGEQTLPLSLWLRFDLEVRQRLLAVLEFLSPITTPAAWKELGGCEVHSGSRRGCR
jgi:hypothetical protein